MIEFWVEGLLVRSTTVQRDQSVHGGNIATCKTNFGLFSAAMKKGMPTTLVIRSYAAKLSIAYPVRCEP